MIMVEKFAIGIGERARCWVDLWQVWRENFALGSSGAVNRVLSGHDNSKWGKRKMRCQRGVGEESKRAVLTIRHLSGSGLGPTKGDIHFYTSRLDGSCSI